MARKDVLRTWCSICGRQIPLSRSKWVKVGHSKSAGCKGCHELQQAQEQLALIEDDITECRVHSNAWDEYTSIGDAAEEVETMYLRVGTQLDKLKDYLSKMVKTSRIQKEKLQKEKQT